MEIFTSMMILAFAIITAIIISSLPLYFTVKLLGGKTSIIKVFITNILVGIVSGLAFSKFGAGSLIILFITIGIYSVLFKLGIIKSLLAFFIQYIIAGIIFFITLIMLGISITTII